MRHTAKTITLLMLFRDNAMILPRLAYHPTMQWNIALLFSSEYNILAYSRLQWKCHLNIGAKALWFQCFKVVLGLLLAVYKVYKHTVAGQSWCIFYFWYWMSNLLQIIILPSLPIVMWPHMLPAGPVPQKSSTHSLPPLQSMQLFLAHLETTASISPKYLYIYKCLYI